MRLTSVLGETHIFAVTIMPFPLGELFLFPFAVPVCLCVLSSTSSGGFGTLTFLPFLSFPLPPPHPPHTQ